MQRFRRRWSTLPDRRKPNNNQRYTIAAGALAAFSVFFIQSPSFLAHQRLLQSRKWRNNARSLFQVTEIPSDPQIRNLLEPLTENQHSVRHLQGIIARNSPESSFYRSQGPDLVEVTEAESKRCLSQNSP